MTVSPSTLLVQCDFDDTITYGNVSTALREAFAPPEWTDMEAEYLEHRYSVEESNIRQYALVRVTEEQVNEFVLRNVEVRQGFGRFVDRCRSRGIRLVIASSGLDLYIAPTLEKCGLKGMEVYAATGRVTADGIRVAYEHPEGGPLTSGFKESYLRRFRAAGHTVVYVGDGLSDVTPALEADFVIARSYLCRHLCQQDVPHYSFEDFTEVQRHVDDVCARLGIQGPTCGV